MKSAQSQHSNPHAVAGTEGARMSVPDTRLRAQLREHELPVDVFGWLNWSEIELSSTHDLEQLFFQLSVHGKNLSEAKYALVLPCNAEQTLGKGIGDDADSQFATAIGETLARQPLKSFDENPGEIQPVVLAGNSDPASQQAWVVPLDGQTRRYGVLVLSARCDGKALQPGAELNLHLVANAVTRVLERAQLIDDLHQSNANLARERAAERELVERLKQTQEQLVQSEKLASIGQLAAGVAHEINNPVGFLTANMTALDESIQDLFSVIDAFEAIEAAADDCAEAARQLQQAKKKADLEYLRDDLPKLISESQDGLARVKRIVRDLKNFSHVEAAEFQQADLLAGLRSTLNIVHNELKYKAEVVMELGELPAVECIVSQLNQVFMNLLVNAGHAIEKDGRITVRSMARDGEVSIEIHDNGCGIPADVRKRIFEPFFTTKPVGKGTGLGLSLSYGIVERHHGRIEVESEPGSGTCFRVTLPIQQPRTKTLHS